MFCGICKALCEYKQGSSSSLCLIVAVQYLEIGTVAPPIVGKVCFYVLIFTLQHLRIKRDMVLIGETDFPSFFMAPGPIVLSRLGSDKHILLNYWLDSAGDET